MLSTERLFDNLEKNEFRKTKIDLKKAVEGIQKKRVSEKKKEIVAKYQEK
jgi:hypothetical protein